TMFLDGFWQKSKRAIEKPAESGPAAYVIPADDAHRGARSRLLQVLDYQHCEISRLDAAAEVTLEVAKSKSGNDRNSGAANRADASRDDHATKQKSRTFAAGDFVVRMDQPYSRVADALLDRQYWSPQDPQKHPYDDTGWSMGDLFGVEVVRVTDPAILATPM